MLLMLLFWACGCTLSIKHGAASTPVSQPQSLRHHFNLLAQITLRGSTDTVVEFFGYAINSILYQRGCCLRCLPLALAVLMQVWASHSLHKEDSSSGSRPVTADLESIYSVHGALGSLQWHKQLLVFGRSFLKRHLVGASEKSLAHFSSLLVQDLGQLQAKYAVKGPAAVRLGSNLHHPLVGLMCISSNNSLNLFLAKHVFVESLAQCICAGLRQGLPAGELYFRGQVRIASWPPFWCWDWLKVRAPKDQLNMRIVPYMISGIPIILSL